MGETEGTRFKSLDALKGSIIVAVVFTHLIISSTGTEADRELPLLIQIPYLGLMSFFIISGYFFRPGRGFAENIRRRGNQLVVALVACSVILPVITYIWLAILGQPSDPSDIIKAIIFNCYLHDLFTPLGPTESYIACATSVGYYFLWAMMGGFLIFYALADRVLDDWKKLSLTIIVILVAFMLFVEFWPVMLPFFFEVAPLAALFMFAGAILAKYKFIEKVETFAWRSFGYWLPFIISLVAGIVLCLIFPPGAQFDWAKFGDYGGWSVITFILEAILLFAVFVYIAMIVTKLPLLPRFLYLASSHSLGLLLYHGFIATVIIAPFYVIPTTSWFPEMGITNRVAAALATIAICLVICEYGPKVISRIRSRTAAVKETA